jgi:hypothetical protein
MSYDGLPERAGAGARAAITDRSSVPGASRPGPTHLIGRMATLGAITAFAFAACSGSSGTAAPGASGSSAANTPGSSIASPEASPSASAPTRIVIQVVAQNNSKVTGGAVLSDLGDGSIAVTVGVIAIGFEDPMPAQIVSGNCADMAGLTPSAAPSGAASMAPSVVPSVVPSASGGASGSPGPSASVDPNGPFPLKDVTGGSSNTVVPTSLSNLLAQPFAIVIHKSAADPTIVACADITAAGIPVPSGLESAMPSLPAPSSSP